MGNTTDKNATTDLSYCETFEEGELYGRVRELKALQQWATVYSIGMAPVKRYIERRVEELEGKK